jgi:hypothetical protein
MTFNRTIVAARHALPSQIMPVWTIWYVEAFLPLVALSLLAAWRWGSATELLVALLYLAATDLQKAFAGNAGIRFVHFEPAVATIDITVLVGLSILAHRQPRLWIIGSAALQFIACLAHVAKAIQPAMPALVYEILMGSTGYPLLLLLWAGIAASKRQAATRTREIARMPAARQR